jgi:hypothetical protein
LHGHADDLFERAPLLDLASACRLHKQNVVLLIGTRSLKESDAMLMNSDRLFANMKRQPEAIIATATADICDGVDFLMLNSTGLKVP